MKIDDAFDPLPPHSIEAECCLLGSLLLDPPQRERIVPSLRPDDFFLADHAIVFTIMRDLTLERRPLDAVILSDELKARRQLDEIGGSGYIAQILSSVPSSAHASEYAARVLEHAARRAIITLADLSSRRARGGVEDASTVAGDLIARVGDVLARRSSGEVLDWGAMIDAAYEGVGDGGVETVRFGWPSLDRVTGGIALGESVIVAARPSMGKSTFARNVAVNVAASGVPVGFISLEETPAKIARNALAAGAAVTNHRLRNGTDITADEFQSLAQWATRLRGLPIFVNARARTVEQLRAVAHTMRARHGVKLLIIDHLSRVRAPGRDIYERVTAASGAVTDLVKDLGVAGLVLCQLNRDLERRDDKRPMLADLRDSGAIEQDADGVILLHRDDYFGARDASYIQNGVVEVMVAKWRDGERGQTIRLKAEMRYQRFVEWTDRHAYEVATGNGPE